jgi:hypothetical protein
MALVGALDVVQFCLCFTNRTLWRVLVGAAVQAGVIQSFERVIHLVKRNLFPAVFPFSQTITFSVQASLLYGVLNIKSSPGSHHADLRTTVGRQPLESVERGMIGICPRAIVVRPDLSAERISRLMWNLYEQVRSQKGKLENGIEDPLRRLAPARRVVIRGSPTHASIPLAHRSATMMNKEWQC